MIRNIEICDHLVNIMQGGEHLRAKKQHKDQFSLADLITAWTPLWEKYNDERQELLEAVQKKYPTLVEAQLITLEPSSKASDLSFYEQKEPTPRIAKKNRGLSYKRKSGGDLVVWYPKNIANFSLTKENIDKVDQIITANLILYHHDIASSTNHFLLSHNGEHTYLYYNIPFDMLSYRNLFQYNGKTQKLTCGPSLPHSIKNLLQEEFIVEDKGKQTCYTGMEILARNIYFDKEDIPSYLKAPLEDVSPKTKVHTLYHKNGKEIF